MLRLRPAATSNPDDIAWLLSILQHETADGVRQWAGSTIRYPVDREQLERHFRRLNVKIPPRRAFVACNSEANSGDSVRGGDLRAGYVELFNIKQRGSAFITRMLVHPRFRGRGVGPEMLRQVLERGFGEFNLHRIELNVYDFNTPAIRCYEKAGFQKEGLMRGITFTGREYWNAYRMAILEEEWRSRPRPQSR
jgi:RimJ/RimL family protein N-acetyltransferase